MELARMCFVHSKGIHPIFVIKILRISEEKSLKFKITRYDYFIRKYMVKDYISLEINLPQFSREI